MLGPILYFAEFEALMRDFFDKRTAATPDADPETIKELIIEALTRGAKPHDIARLETDFVKRVSRSRDGLGSWSLGTSFSHSNRAKPWSVHPLGIREPPRVRLLDGDLNVRMLWSRVLPKAEAEFLRRAKAEFADFDKNCKKAFEEDQKDRIQNYVDIRAVLYTNGYDAPSIFSKVRFTKSPFLGKHPLVHSAFEKNLNEVLKNLPGHMLPKLASEFKRIERFVPRRKRGAKGFKLSSLSYHAVGLALDLNPQNNPFIGGRSRKEVELLKQITGFDFGKDLSADGGTPQEAWKKEKAASEKLQAWLRIWLPLRDGLKKLDHDTVAQQPKDAPGLLDPPSTGSRYGVSSESSNSLAQSIMNSSKDLILLQSLLKIRTYDELRTWEDNGILSIPLALVNAMVEAGYEWAGSTYVHNKDLMHFELKLEKIEKHEKPRPLEELFHYHVKSVAQNDDSGGSGAIC